LSRSKIYLYRSRDKVHWYIFIEIEGQRKGEGERKRIGEGERKREKERKREETNPMMMLIFIANLMIGEQSRSVISRPDLKTH
jgi:hypothetical protein